MIARHVFSAVVVLALFAAVTAGAHARERKTTPRRQKARAAAPAPKADLRQHNVVREEGRAVIYKKRNVVEFDGSLIEGDVRNPSEFYFVHRPEEKFGTLVKRRPNFHKEMLRDAVMIR